LEIFLRNCSYGKNFKLLRKDSVPSYLRVGYLSFFTTKRWSLTGVSAPLEVPPQVPRLEFIIHRIHFLNKNWNWTKANKKSSSTIKCLNQPTQPTPSSSNSKKSIKIKVIIKRNKHVIIVKNMNKVHWTQSLVIRISNIDCSLIALLIHFQLTNKNCLLCWKFI
jgi:hypothetical protein